MKQIKVLHLSTSGMLLDTFIAPSLGIFDRNEYTFEFACSKYSPTSINYIDNLQEAGFKVHIFDFSYNINLFSDLYYILKLIIFLRKNRFDIIHTHSSKGGVIGRISGFFARCPIIFHTVHSFYFHDEDLPFIKKIFFKYIETVLSMITTKVFFVSYQLIDEALTLNIVRQNKIQYIGPYLQSLKTEFSQIINLDSNFQFYPIPHNKLIIGSISRLVRSKRIDIFIKIAAELVTRNSDLHFIIIGDGPEYPILYDLVCDLKLDNCFTFTKSLSKKDTLALLQKFDIFFLPTSREGFGVVFAEAMASKVPIIGPNIRPISDFVVDTECGYLCNNDLKAYLEKIQYLINNPLKRKEMGLKGFEIIWNLLNEDNNSHLIYDTYQYEIFNRARFN